MRLPARFIPIVKELERSGMTVVPIGRKNVSDKAVDKVITAADKIEGLGEKAERVAAHLEQSISETDDTLEVAQEFSNRIRSAGAALKGKLGTQTNAHPPGKAKAGDSGTGGAGTTG